MSHFFIFLRPYIIPRSYWRISIIPRFTVNQIPVAYLQLRYLQW